MSGNIRTNEQQYTLTELAQLLRVEEEEAAEILEEHGYQVPLGDGLLTLSEEDYLDLMEEAPIDADSIG